MVSSRRSTLTAWAALTAFATPTTRMVAVANHVVAVRNGTAQMTCRNESAVQPIASQASAPTSHVQRRRYSRLSDDRPRLRPKPRSANATAMTSSTKLVRSRRCHVRTWPREAQGTRSADEWSA